MNGSEQSRTVGSGNTNTLSLVDDELRLGHSRSTTGLDGQMYCGYIGELFIANSDQRTNVGLCNYLNTKWNLY